MTVKSVDRAGGAVGRRLRRSGPQARAEVEP